MDYIVLAIAVAGVVGAVVISVLLHKRKISKVFELAQEESKKILEDARRESDQILKESKIDAKKETARHKQQRQQRVVHPAEVH